MLRQAVHWRSRGAESRVRAPATPHWARSRALRPGSPGHADTRRVRRPGVGSVERDHELAPEALAQRFRCDERSSSDDRACWPSASSASLRSSTQASRSSSRRLASTREQPSSADVGERRSAPHREGGAQAVGREPRCAAAERSPAPRAADARTGRRPPAPAASIAYPAARVRTASDPRSTARSRATYERSVVAAPGGGAPCQSSSSADRSKPGARVRGGAVRGGSAVDDRPVATADRPVRLLPGRASGSRWPRKQDSPRRMHL